MRSVHAPLRKSQELRVKHVVLGKLGRYLSADHPSCSSTPELHENRTEKHAMKPAYHIAQRNQGAIG
jgi:hypothetical protein